LPPLDQLSRAGLMELFMKGLIKLRPDPEKPRSPEWHDWNVKRDLHLRSGRTFDDPEPTS
jgi:hypothetical protein